MNVIIVTPSGRKQYLERLYQCLLKQKEHFDEWHLWLNTDVESDMIFIKQLEDKHTWIHVIKINLQFTARSCKNVNLFYDYCKKSNHIYIKIDDDIVWLHPDFLKNLIHFRSKENCPLVFANVYNNTYMDQFNYKANTFQVRSVNHIKYKEYDTCSLDETLIIHKHFKNNQADSFLFENKTIEHHTRVGIQCISWIGNMYPKMFDNMFKDDERWLSFMYPLQIDKQNKICGNALCVHYSHRTQNPDNVLDKYLDDLYPI